MKHAMLQSQALNKNIWNEEDDFDEKQSLMESERLHQQQQIQEELEFEQVRTIIFIFLSVNNLET